MTLPSHQKDADVKGTKDAFIPALRFHWLTPLYDKIVSFTSQEEQFKDILLNEADLADNHTLLDIGCGSGTLVINAALRNGACIIHGLDADENILKTAHHKSQQNDVKIHFKQGYSTELPYPDNHFDRVFSSLLFHHLSLDSKIRTLKEIYRVLKPGGEFYFADWGKPRTLFRKISFFMLRLFDGLDNTRDCLTNKIPDKMKHLGFDVSETGQVPTLLGDIVILKVRKSYPR